MNELALFAGAGGGILANELIGDTTICAVERDAFAAQVLAQRQNDGIFKPFPIWSDVRSFDGKPWRGIVKAISGGFPCQDVSSQGGVMELTEKAPANGVKWVESSVKYDLNGCEWRTHRCLWDEVLPWSSVTLPRWGMTVAGVVYQHPTLERPISATVSGLLPTPMASDWKGGTTAIRKDTGKQRLDQFRDWCKSLHGLTYPIPEHSEAMMLWPIGWSDLKPLAMARFRQWQQQHGKF